MTTDPRPTEFSEQLDTAALRRAAADEGLPVSDRLLETLRRDGLVPRPTRVGYRGRSPVWAYPAVAVPQLLALLRWREQTKDPDALRLILWVEGYQIHTSDVRAALVRWWESATAMVDREFRARAERLGLDPDRDEDRPAVLQEMSRELTAKRGPRSIPRRGRIPAAERAHAMDVMLRRFLLDLPADGDVEQEAQKIEKVLGIAKDRITTIPGSGPWLTGPAASLLDAADIIAVPRLLEAAL